MIKYALPVAVLYFAVGTAAVALPGSTLPQLTSPNDVVQVGSKGKGKGHAKGHGKVIPTTTIITTTTTITTATISTTITAATGDTATATGHMGGRPWAASQRARSGIAR